MAPRVPLREFGESNLSYELRRFGMIWEDENPGGIMERRLADALMDPAYGAEFAIGFLDGFRQGGGERLRVWRDELEVGMRALLGFVVEEGGVVLAVGVGASLWEFFAKKFDPKRPGTVSPEVERALEQLEIIHDLRPLMGTLAILDSEFQTRSLLDSLGLVASDIAASLVAEGRAWTRTFLTATGDAGKQGTMLGRFIGEAFVELFRAFVEPPTLTIVELAGLFGLDNDEVRTLAPAGTP